MADAEEMVAVEDDVEDEMMPLVLGLLAEQVPAAVEEGVTVSVTVTVLQPQPGAASVVGDSQANKSTVPT